MDQRSTAIRILAVDDSPMNIKLLEAILTPQGFIVEGAANGAEAIRKVYAITPDLILMDVMMPQMNGYETCRKIREDKSLPFIPVIFITASELEQDNVAEGLDSGGDDYIRKPFNIVELVSRVNANLRVKKTYDELARTKAELSRYVSLSTLKMVNDKDGDQKPNHRVENLTVLFSDIRGFTQLSMDEAPETVFERLNRSIEKQIGVIEKFNGVIDKLSGDEVMAVFEGPRMADDAIACAFKIVETLSASNSIQNDSWASVGIGINTGPVFVGNLGSESFRDHTVVGHAVNIAARLCGLAQKFQILCTRSTLTAMQERKYSCRSIGKKMLKGLKEPLELYEVFL